EDPRAAFRNLQEIPKGRNGTVMQIGSASPGTVDRQIAVTIGFAVRIELERRIVDLVEAVDERRAEGIQSVPVRPDCGDRGHLPDGGLTPLVALRALLLVDGFPSVGSSGIDRIGKLWRREV